MTNRNMVAALILMAAMCAFMSSCASREWQSADGAVWGTTYHVSYRGGEDLHDSIRAVMRGVEMSLSPFSEASVISRINRGESVEADSNILKVFQGAKMVHGASCGAFDPTVAPAVNLWGFGYKKTGVEPSQAQVDSVSPLVGFGLCAVDNGRVVSEIAGAEYDFSAITKGYGCDMVGKMLERNGCTDYMVEIGGEIALSGMNSRNEPWHIMIDAPIEADTVVVHKKFAVVELTDCGIATSGNYRNFKTTASGKIWHTIDPRTCRPAVTTTLSATVIAPTAMLADAFATACMVMPADSAVAMIESQRDVSALLVVMGEKGEWKVVASSGFPAFK